MTQGVWLAAQRWPLPGAARLGGAAAVVLAGALATGAAAGAVAADEAWRLELADGAVAAIEPPQVRAEGGVRFVQGELEVEAHRAVYDDAERVIAFFGQVRARRPGQVLEGETARVELRTGEVSVQEARARFEAEGVEGPIFMEAASMEGDPAEVRASGAVLTTCPLPMKLAHYRVTVRSLEVRPGKDVAARDAVFWESGIPLFYWPYLHFSLENPRAGRFVPPEVGYGAREGWYVRSRFPYMGPGSTYGYVGIDYFQRLGPGLELYQALYDDGDTWAAVWLGGTLRGPDGSPPDLRTGSEGE
ncbi:MAG: LPS-assembly protein LptD, partial [Firmicutes bacterium]|nr:LPS-assembly protein LptD [Bacillota bacterium]